MYKSLQGYRAIAAMLVVLFHMGGTMAAHKYFAIDSFAIPFSFGSCGVEFFFVLSGFIIFAAHRADISQPQKLLTYIRKRFVRIYPTYWIIFLVVFGLAIVSSSLRNTVPHDLLVLLKSLLLVPQDKSLIGGSGAPVLIVAWTLQYEMFFYLFFALLILNRWLATVATIVLIYIYFNCSASSIFPLSFLSQNYIILFAMGMAVAYGYKRFQSNNPFFLVVVGLLVFFLLALDTVFNTDLLKDGRTIFYGVSASLIVFGLVQLEDGGRVVFGHRWMQLIGDASYSLYLLHFPLVSILCKLAMMVHLNMLGFLGAIITYISIFCISVVSALLFHLNIEKPIASYLKRR